MTINGKLDTNFSEATEAVGWRQVSDALAAAELYWLTTVRKDGRPHITPLIGAWVDDGFVFCTRTRGTEGAESRGFHRGGGDHRGEHVEGRTRRRRRRVRRADDRARHVDPAGRCDPRKVPRRMGFHAARRRLRPYRRQRRQSHRLRVPGATRQGAGVREVTPRPDPLPAF